MPLTAIRSLQEGAPEKVTIEVIEANKKEVERGGGFLFEMTVEAKVVAVEASEAELKKGDAVTIRYSFPNFEKTPAAGDWAGEVAKGKKYQAYLKMKGRNAAPAAASGSFEKPVSDKP